MAQNVQAHPHGGPGESVNSEQTSDGPTCRVQRMVRPLRSDSEKTFKLEEFDGKYRIDFKGHYRAMHKLMNTLRAIDPECKGINCRLVPGMGGDSLLLDCR
jgi:hypothetical protein